MAKKIRATKNEILLLNFRFLHPVSQHTKTIFHYIKFVCWCPIGLILESKCFKVDFYLYGDSRGASKWDFFSTPNLEVHQNRFLLYAEIRLRTKLQKHDFVLYADIQDAPKWIYFYTHNFEVHQSGKKKYGYTKKEKLTVENEFLCMLESDMPKSCKNKVRTP